MSQYRPRGRARLSETIADRRINVATVRMRAVCFELDLDKREQAKALTRLADGLGLSEYLRVETVDPDESNDTRDHHG